MGFELVNRLEAELGIAVPMTLLLQGPSLAELAEQLLARLAPPSGVAPTPVSEQETDEELLARVDQLSDEEVDALLREIVEESNVDVTAPDGEIGA
jgi:hypothetical protein